MVKFILIKSPEEWATTKQACRDEFVVYLFFSSIYSSLYFYVLSTVLRISSFKFYTRNSPSVFPYLVKLNDNGSYDRLREPIRKLENHYPELKIY